MFKRLDHIGIVVNDLPAAKAFFLDFGMEVLGEAEQGGPWLDEIVGVKGSKTAFVVMSTPGGGANIELIKYYEPVDGREFPQDYSNTPGIRNICFEVDDIEAVLATLKTKGIESFGEVQQYEDSYKLCYCRGPEGIILMLAEALK